MPPQTRGGHVTREEMWERLRGTAKGRRFYTTLSEQERKEWPIMLLLGYCKKLRLLTPLEEFETTPKVYTTVASYLDKFLPPPLNTFRVVWAICSLVFLLSLLFHRGSVILNLRAMVELGGMKRRPSEALRWRARNVNTARSWTIYKSTNQPQQRRSKHSYRSCGPPGARRAPGDCATCSAIACWDGRCRRCRGRQLSCTYSAWASRGGV